MAPWCIYNSCLERAARSGSGRDSVRGSVGSMNAELSGPDGLATVQLGRKLAQSRVCTPGFTQASTISLCVRLSNFSKSNGIAKAVKALAFLIIAYEEPFVMTGVGPYYGRHR